MTMIRWRHIALSVGNDNSDKFESLIFTPRRASGSDSRRLFQTLSIKRCDISMDVRVFDPLKNNDYATCH